ncbi:hypothetical protein [Brevibacterium luteolum]|uniref:hypothetical protein n=1 Tax=Brevibacterium luteolum TaxID=199591 RepID=UPI00223B346C|nr:hypothetical protein [Brevibacterium luteolum]MCT1829382.1 hypothetical protein [Brevibacterium luteolum]
MVLPVRGISGAADDCAADSHRGCCRLEVEVTQPDGQHLPDAGGSAEHDLDDLVELTVGARPCGDLSFFPLPNGSTDETDFFRCEGVDLSGRAAQSADVVHWVARDEFVPNCEAECEAHDVAGLAGAVVALLGELLDEVVAPGHTDLSQGQIREDRQHEGAHVALVKEPGRS